MQYELLKVDEAARILAVDVKTCYAIKADLPSGCIVKIGRRLRFRADLLRQFVEAGGKAKK